MTDTIDADAPTPTANPVRTLAPLDATGAVAVDTLGAAGQVDPVGAWTPLPASPSGLTDVAAVSGSNWWAVDTASTLWRVEGSVATRSGTGIAVGAAADGTVWSLDVAGAAQQWVGNGWRTHSTEPRMRAISVASADIVAGLDDTGAAWLWSDADAAWQPCPGAPVLTSLGADPHGALWGVDADGALWAWLGAWTRSGGQELACVEAAADGSLWLLNTAGNVAVLTDPLAEPEHPGPKVLPQWDAESVFDESQSTHLWIVNRAARLIGRSGGALGAQLCQLIGPDIHRTDTKFHNGLCQGLLDADFKAPYNNPNFVNVATYKSHFYDPDTRLNYLRETSPTALTETTHFFHQSVRAARTNLAQVATNYDAGYAFGLALHYFTDTTQPMHAANFTAIDWPFTFHGAFESWMMANQATLPVTDSYVPPPVTDPAALLTATARRSKPHYRRDVAIAINPWMPWSLRPVWDLSKLSRPAMGQILSEAVTATAQYLMAWIMNVNQPRTALPAPLLAMGGPQQVAHLSDSDGGLMLLRYSNGWTLTDLSADASFPAPAEDPVTAVAGWSGDQHLYRSADGAIIQLWRDQGVVHCTDLTAAAKAPGCRGDSRFATLTSPQRQLYYAATDGALHCLWYQNGWQDTDLSGLTGAPGPTPGTAIAAGGPGQFVHYFGVDTHLHCLHCDPQGWHHIDLSATAPAMRPRAGTALSASYRAVLLVGDDGHIWIRVAVPGPKLVDLTAAAGAPPAGEGTPLASLSDPQAQLFYLADSGHVTQLWFQDHWRCTDLTVTTNAPPPVAGSDLVALNTPQPQQVFYVAADNHVHQLWYQGQWRHTDLSASV